MSVYLCAGNISAADRAIYIVFDIHGTELIPDAIGWSKSPFGQIQYCTWLNRNNSAADCQISVKSLCMCIIGLKAASRSKLQLEVEINRQWPPFVGHPAYIEGLIF